MKLVFCYMLEKKSTYELYMTLAIQVVKNLLN
jgi:hypothetical protein